MSRSRGLLTLFAAWWLLTLGCATKLALGCATKTEIRIENRSSLDYTDVSVAGQPYGDIAAGATSDYKSVKLNFGYAVIELRADGQYVTGQTLNMGARRFTHRIDVVDLAAGHLAIEVISP